MFICVFHTGNGNHETVRGVGAMSAARIVKASDHAHVYARDNVPAWFSTLILRIAFKIVGI